MGKAQRALSAARLLLTASETEGACNRAYYAMFYAAHAALIAVRINPPETGYKTHSGLIGAFGQHVIVGAGMDAELGRSINRVQHDRQVADYSGDPVSLADAAWAVEQAEVFVHAIKGKLMAERP